MNDREFERAKELYGELSKENQTLVANYQKQLQILDNMANLLEEEIKLEKDYLEKKGGKNDLCNSQ